MYPTYAMVNHDGEVTDRWAGYPGVDGFIELADAARADTRTIETKKKAFAAEPTLTLAHSLARYSEAVFANADAVEYYRQAMALAPDEASSLHGRVFMAMYYGLRSGAFSPDELLAEGRAVLADPQVEASTVLQVASVARRVADRDAFLPFLKQALQVSEDATDEQVVQQRRELEVDAALMIDGDAEKALGLKRAMLPEGWREDSGALNGFAWWCFENDVNLPEALELSLRGVELATSDGDRANILDTAAEIAFKSGDVKQAIELETRAVQLAPDREAFQSTLARFKSGADS